MFQELAQTKRSFRNDIIALVCSNAIRPSLERETNILIQYSISMYVHYIKHILNGFEDSLTKAREMRERLQIEVSLP